MDGFEPPQHLANSIKRYQLPVNTSRNRPFICVLSVSNHFS